MMEAMLGANVLLGRPFRDTVSRRRGWSDGFLHFDQNRRSGYDTRASNF